MAKTEERGETDVDTYREEPRAINFSISNRSEKSNKNETNENESRTKTKEAASPTRLTPGHNMYYGGNSNANILSFSPGIYLNCISTIFYIRILLLSR